MELIGFVPVGPRLVLRIGTVGALAVIALAVVALSGVFGGATAP